MDVAAPVVARFWAKVEKHDPDCPCCSGCWLWRGGCNSSGYGVIRTGRGNSFLAVHRLALILDGRPPGDQCARHTCDTPPCVNPAHLLIGTQAENMADMVARRRSLKGARNSQARLTDEAVTEILQRVASGERQCDVRRDYGIAKATISEIVNGHRWSHIAA